MKQKSDAKLSEQSSMSPRERLDAAMNHRPVDKLCVDIGAGGQTGMGVCAVHRLRLAVLGDEGWRVKVTEPYQMLGEIDDELRKVLGLDVVGPEDQDQPFQGRILVPQPKAPSPFKHREAFGRAF